LSGTEGAAIPFFSPDGAWIGFFAGGKLKKVAVHGGTPITLCEAVNILGASWGEDGNIVFTPSNRSGLLRVPDAGGKPEPLTHLDARKNEQTHRFPQVLPGAQAILFTMGTPGNVDDASIEAQVLKTGERKTVYRGGYHGRYLPSGHLVFMHEGNLFAAPMDLKRLELIGPAVPILDDVGNSPTSGSAEFDFSETGTLAYIPGAGSRMQALAWMDASGKLERMSAPPKSYKLPIRVSPDGTRLALIIHDGSFDNLWVYDWQRNRLSPITFGKNSVFGLAWSPDGRHLAFKVSGEMGNWAYWARADGAGQPFRLLEKIFTNDLAISPDGKRLAFTSSNDPQTGGIIQTVLLDLGDPEHPKAGKPEPFPTGSGRNTELAFSPDGRWLAYASTASGAPEVFVSPFPGPGGKWPVSNGQGNHPVWSRTAQELFYQDAPGRMMVVTYTTKGDSFEADPPRVWTDRALPHRNNALAPDGKRFAVVIPADESAGKAPTHVVFLLNFFDELKRRVPVK
jgi:serine/threonine-protein kinase